MFLDFLKKFFGPFLPKTVDKTKVKRQWQKIEELMKLGGESNFEKAVILADKLVNWVMQEKGARGNTFAERARSFRQKFSDCNGLWQAHILRNHIVHDPDFETYKFSAEKAIANFKKALRDLGGL